MNTTVVTKKELHSAFESMTGNARTWIFQCNRLLNAEEQSAIEEMLNRFTNQWTSHERQVNSIGVVLHRCFLVMMADETAFAISGCGIDKLTALMRELDTRFNLDLFNRFNTAYIGSDDTLHLASRDEIQQLVNSGAITADTMVFNNMVTTKKELIHSWQCRLGDSWHASVFL
jgi:hypothetical protein